MSNPSDAITPSPVSGQSRGSSGYLNYFTVVCGIVTIASFAFAVYWYAQSRQEREPTYYISPARARIVDSSVSTPQLQILYRGKDLNSNISAVIVYFWNAGKRGQRPLFCHDRSMGVRHIPASIRILE